MVIIRDTLIIWFTIITLSVTLCTGQDLNSGHKYKPNLDFLQHESGTTPTKSEYASLFPPLPSKNIPGSSSSTANANAQSSGKRDYVASDFPALKPSASRNNGHSPTASTTSILSQQPGGKRDYVASDFPSLKPISNQHNGQTISPVSPSTTNKNTLQTNAKRDYVAPQYTTPVTPSASNGKVKDLINFFGGQGPNNKPSYSSVIGGGQSTQSTIRMTQPIPTSSKDGLNKHGTTIPSSAWINGHSTTAKPTTRLPLKPVSPVTNTRNPAGQRPGSTLMPSSFVSNKKEQGSGNGPSDTEIEVLSEELIRKDSNNAAKLITINVQEKSSVQSMDDKAPQPLFVIPDKVWNMPTIQKFVPLLDNYERDTTVNEYVTPQERSEENAFLDAIMSTAVIRHLMNFLKEKGYVTPDPKQQRDFLKQLWFSLYARSRGKLSSSGFEHIFVSELKNGAVSGLHNWIYFSKEESANRINYLGYQKYLQLNDKGAILKLHFNQQGADKPVDTIFIGTSPELEVALYTLCFVTRADKDCKLKLAGKDVNIVTHTFRYRSKNLIGSAYPQF